VFALIAGVTLGIAAAFAMAGAWLILPFAGLEVALVAAAFLAIGRHATDYERLDFAAGRLAVEVAAGGVTQRHLLEARAARVSLEARDGCQRLLLRAAGASLELGRHLDEAARRELAAELKDRLRIRIGKE